MTTTVTRKVQQLNKMYSYLPHRYLTANFNLCLKDVVNEVDVEVEDSELDELDEDNVQGDEVGCSVDRLLGKVITLFCCIPTRN